MAGVRQQAELTWRPKELPISFPRFLQQLRDRDLKVSNTPQCYWYLWGVLENFAMGSFAEEEVHRFLWQEGCFFRAPPSWARPVRPSCVRSGENHRQNFTDSPGILRGSWKQ